MHISVFKATNDTEMGSFFATEEEPDASFVMERGHKTYVVTTPDINILKVGYTRRTLRKGVWNAYRRAYGEKMVILRVYPAKEEREDEKIHRALVKYRDVESGNEIYKKKYQDTILLKLDAWHGTKGVGPFAKSDVMAMSKEHREKEPTKTLSLAFGDMAISSPKAREKKLKSDWK